MIDTHAHLNFSSFDQDRDGVISRAFGCGVTHIVEIADEPEEWEAALSLVRRYPGRMACAWGFHPHHAAALTGEHLETLKKNLSRSEIVALGEIGIDYAKSEAAPEIQKKALGELLALAVEAGKPIVLHCREGRLGLRSQNGDAYRDLFGVVEAVVGPGKGRRRFRGVLHCFSGSENDARRANDFGLALGVDGPITYPKNNDLRQAILSAGLDRIVLETDSPFLPPQSIRGQRNDPARLPEIARSVAALFGVSVEEVARRTTQNASDLFGLS